MSGKNKTYNVIHRKGSLKIRDTQFKWNSMNDVCVCMYLIDEKENEKKNKNFYLNTNFTHCNIFQWMKTEKINNNKKVQIFCYQIIMHLILFCFFFFAILIIDWLCCYWNWEYSLTKVLFIKSIYFVLIFMVKLILIEKQNKNKNEKK